MRPKPITIAEVEYTAFSLAEKFMTWDEPIPNFGSRFPNVLESCLETPFQKFSKKDLYRGLIGKASIMFYLMIKNHPFQNGNKRIAVMTMLYFLHKNNKWLKVDSIELYKFARFIAKSSPKLRDKTMTSILDFMNENIIEFKE